MIPLRLPRDWWLVFALVPLGWMAWMGLFYAAIKGRRPRWIAEGALYLGATVALIVVGSAGEGTAAKETYVEVATYGSLGLWMIVGAHVFHIRPQLYSRVEAREAAARRALEAEAAREIVRSSPERARMLGVGRPDIPGARHYDLIDVNHVSPDVLARLPGLDMRTAAQIAHLRPFTSVEDLGSALELAPHVVEDLRTSTVFLR